MAGFLGGREKVGEKWKRDKKQYIEVGRVVRGGMVSENFVGVCGASGDFPRL